MVLKSRGEEEALEAIQGSATVVAVGWGQAHDSVRDTSIRQHRPGTGQLLPAALRHRPQPLQP